MNKIWQDEAWEDFEYWTKQDRKTLKRILQLLQDIDRNGYEGIGKLNLIYELNRYLFHSSSALLLLIDRIFVQCRVSIIMFFPIH